MGSAKKDTPKKASAEASPESQNNAPISASISIGGSVIDSNVIVGHSNTIIIQRESDPLYNLRPARREIDSIKIPYFVGRTQQLAEIQSNWEQVRTERNLRFVIIDGLPGSGKTSLVQMFLKLSIDEKTAFYEVKCDRKHTNDALAPFRVMFTEDAADAKANQAVAQASQEQSIIVTADAQKQQTMRFSRFVNSLKDEVRALSGLVLFFDDIQWIDETSMGLLDYMSEMLTDTPILVILAHRRVEMRRRKRIHKSLLDLENKWPHHVSVIQLSEGINILEYVNQRFPKNLFDSKFVRDVQKGTKGNPFVVEVFFKVLVHRKLIYNEAPANQWQVQASEKIVIPRDAWAAIDEQVQEVKSKHLDLIKSASTEGEVFSLEILCDARSNPPEEVEKVLQRFENMDIIERWFDIEVNGQSILQYKFSHSLYRDYFYDKQLRAERKKNHANIARAIRNLYSHDLAPVAPQLSGHYEVAEDFGNAFEFAFMAGKEARKKYSWQQEKSWAEKCEQFINKLGENKVDKATRSQVVIMQADGPAETTAGLRNSEKKLKETIAALDEPQYAKIKCEALISLAYIQYDLGTSKAAQTGKLAAQLAQEILEPQLKYEAVSILSDILVDNDENFEEGELALKEAIEIAEELQDSYKLAGALASYAWLLTDLGRTDESYENGIKALNLANAGNFEEDSYKAYIFRMAATAFEAKREFSRAIENYHKSMKIYEELGDKIKICWLLYDIGDCYEQTHDFDKAIEHFEKCLAEARRIDNKDTILWSLVSWADIDLRENRPEPAAKRLAEAEIIMHDEERDATPQDILEYKTSLSLLKFLQGDVATATQTGLEVIHDAKYDVDRFYPYLHLGKYGTKTGDFSRAREYLTKSANIALDMHDPYWLALSHEELGNLCNAENDPFGALHHFEYALRKVSSFYHESGLNELSDKIAAAKRLIDEKIGQSSGELIVLSRTYSTADGQPTISYIHRQIFLKKYFTHCLDCGFCNDSCCSYGVDIDIINAEKIRAVKNEIVRFIRPTADEWFEPEFLYDVEYPGSLYSRTKTHGNRCVFISANQRGCGLQRYAISKGIDYHSIKPFVCSLFPVTFGLGILSVSTELEDGSLICSGQGLSAYRGVRDELKYYFGQDLIDELDSLENTVLAQNPLQT